jgi:hypothetical protein
MFRYEVFSWRLLAHLVPGCQLQSQPSQLTVLQRGASSLFEEFFLDAFQFIE